MLCVPRGAVAFAGRARLLPSRWASRLGRSLALPARQQLQAAVSGQLVADALEQLLCGADALGLAQPAALVLDTDVTAVAGVLDDFHHPAVVGLGLVPAGVEVV